MVRMMMTTGEVTKAKMIKKKIRLHVECWHSQYSISSAAFLNACNPQPITSQYSSEDALFPFFLLRSNFAKDEKKRESK